MKHAVDQESDPIFSLLDGTDFSLEGVGVTPSR